MSKNEIQSKIFDLREKQANVSPEERARIQEQIKQLYKALDAAK
jgi:hypothetical protein